MFNMYDKMAEFKDMIERNEWMNEDENGNCVEFDDLVKQFMAEYQVGQYDYSFDHVFDSPGCDVYAFSLACTLNGDLYFESGYFSRS